MFKQELSKSPIGSQTSPTKEDIENFNKGVEDFAWTCSDRIGDTKTWMVNEKLICHDPIETLYYSSMVDGTQDTKNKLICYRCGDSLDSDVLQKYIDDKTVCIQVKPTCTSTKFTVHRKFKWHLPKNRKVDKKWSAKHLVTRKLTALQRLEDEKKRAHEKKQN